MNTIEAVEQMKYEKVYNFRDIGGLNTEDGRRMKTGVLFRSDDLSRLSQTDLEKMRRLNLRMICDLRTIKERKSKPGRIPTNVGLKLVHVPIYHESQDFSRIDFFKFLLGSKEIDFADMLSDFYQKMAFERTEQIKEIFSLISKQGSLPALIHCTGGKDRTGFIAALIQLVVGVPYDAVIDHYLISNELIGPRMKKIERMIRWMSLFQVSSERMKPLLEVRREYLDESLRGILNKYGTIEEYLYSACKIDKQTIAKLKEILVE